jgi:type 2 lantibiotic biosynthesis protein LanM
MTADNKFFSEYFADAIRNRFLGEYATVKSRWTDIAARNDPGRSALYLESHTSREERKSECSIENLFDCDDADLAFDHQDIPAPAILFYDVFRPILRRARLALSNKLGGYPIQATVFQDCVSHLAGRLSSTAADVLFLEFSTFRCQHNHLPIPSSKTIYFSFVSFLIADGYNELFREYPSLGRLIARLTEDWLRYTCELLVRADQAAGDISVLIEAPDCRIDHLLHIHPTMSDPHNQGRSVYVLEYERGRVVYKPRCCRIDYLFGNLCRWFSENGLTLDIYVPESCVHSDHGWFSFVERRDVLDRPSAERYFTRVGYLLFLFYLLDGTDGHYENMIASGEYPVMVDLETLFQPYLKSSLSDDGPAWLAKSVLRSGLLPRLELSSDGNYWYDISGLATEVRNYSHMVVECWDHINTDMMRRGSVSIALERHANVARLCDTPLHPYDFTEYMLSGFKEIYSIALSNKSSLLKDGGPIAQFRTARYRFVFRPTSLYCNLIRRNIKPDRLSSHEVFGLWYQSLWRGIKDDPWGLSPLVWSEQASLENLDVPVFEGQIGSEHLSCSGFRVESPTHNNLTAVQMKVRDLSFEDLRAQSNLITAAFVSAPRAMLEENANTEIQTLSPSSRAENARIVPTALVMADDLRNAVIQPPTDDLFWIGLRYSSQCHVFQIEPLRLDLYEGYTGLSLLFAACELVSPGCGYIEVAEIAMRPVIRMVTSDSANLNAVPIGFGNGLAGMAYTLGFLHKITNRSEFAEHAMTLMSNVSERIDDDQRLDLLGGSAGVVLSALTLYSLLSVSTMQDVATRAGNLLLKKRHMSVGGNRAWKSNARRLLTGASHGAAGISMALSRLAVATAETLYEDAAQEGLRYERELYSERHRNWPDLRDHTAAAPDHEFVNTWCHGAPGIVLCRLNQFLINSDSDLPMDVQRGLQTTQEGIGAGGYTLCCGDSGRLEVLSTAASCLESEELHRRCDEIARKMIHCYDASQELRIAPHFFGGKYAPGLFQGISGVAYTLLRYRSHLPLPNVLVAENYAAQFTQQRKAITVD